MRAGGALLVSGALAPARRIDGLVALDRELAALAQKPLGDEELQLAKIAAEHATARRGGVGEAVRLAESAVLGVPFAERAAIRDVTAEQVRAAAATYLQPPSRCLVVVGDAASLERELRDGAFGPVSRAPR